MHRALAVFAALTTTCLIGVLSILTASFLMSAVAPRAQVASNADICASTEVRRDFVPTCNTSFDNPQDNLKRVTELRLAALSGTSANAQ